MQTSPLASNLPEEPSRPKHRRFARTRTVFIAGLAVVVPIVATLFLLNAGLQIIDYVAEQIFRGFGLARFLPHYEILGVKIIPLAILFLLIFLAGIFAANAIGRRVLSLCDSLVLRVPLVSTIYSATKQVVETLRTIDGTPNFQYVVYLQYPAPGCHLIGFVTGRYHDSLQDKQMTTVFLPTSPNPITGFVIAVESDHLTPCPLSVEEATKLIVSAGLVVPIPHSAAVTTGPSVSHRI